MKPVYDTAAEIHFIRGLGMFSESEMCLIDKLKGYREGLLKRRRDWLGWPMSPSSRELLLQEVDKRIESCA